MIEIIVAVSLLGLLLIHVGRGAYKSYGGFLAKNPFQYFTWDKSASGTLVGFSYAASMVSAFVFIPLPALFYTHGIGGWLFVCLPVIAATSTLYWFGTRFRKLADSAGEDVYSPFEVIGLAYDSRLLGGYIYLLTALFVVPLISMQIVGFGRLLEGMFDVNYHISIFSLISLFIIYTIFAGMEGDVKTDFYQSIAMLVGLVFLSCYVVYSLIKGYNPENAVDLTKHLSVPGPKGYFSTKTLISIGVMMAALPLVNGHYLMRFMIAKDETALRRGMVSAPLVIFGFYALAAIIGLAGVILVPSLENGDQLTGVLLSRTTGNPLGSIVAGIILFAIISASLSSVDSQFLSLGAGASRDIFKNMFNYKLSDSQQMMTARIIMLLIGLAAIVIALDPPRLVIQLNIMAASGVLLLLPTTIAAVFWPKKFSVRVPLASIAVGVIVFFWVFLEKGSNGLFGWNAGIVSLFVSTIVFCLAAVVWKKVGGKSGDTLLISPFDCRELANRQNCRSTPAP